MIRTLTLAALAVALVAPSAFAQQEESQQRQRSNSRQTADAAADAGPVNDQLFAQVAALVGMAEVTMSQLGVQKATDPELKKFSQEMFAAHTKMNSELMELASKKQMALPRTVDVKAQFCAQSLAGLSGEKFDRCYAKAQAVAHMEAVSAFEAEAERGQDPEVKALAAKALPEIKHHLAMIKPIAMRYEQEHPSTEGAAPAPRRSAPAPAPARGADSDKSER